MALCGIVQHIRAVNRKAELAEYASHRLSLPIYSVPKIVTYFSTSGSKEIEHVRALNPNWIVEVYNETTAREVVATSCTTALSAYDKVASVAGKADIFRLCALLRKGGVYIDDDLYLLHPLDEIVEADSFGLLLVENRPATGYWGNQLRGSTPVCNGLMAASWAEHTFFECALHTVVQNVHTTDPTVSLLQITGPRALGKCADGYTFRYQFEETNSNHFLLCNRTHVIAVHKSLPEPPRKQHYSDLKLQIKV